MALITKDYLNLSALAYIDFNKYLMGATIKELIERKAISEKNLDNSGLSALKDTSNSFRSYKLISFQSNTVSGFTAMAFQAPDKKDKNENVTEKGEIVFSFRGIEISSAVRFQGISSCSFHTSVQMRSLPEEISNLQDFLQ